MKIQPYIEKLESSQEFDKFQTDYPNAFLVAGFFVLDFETNHNIHQVDYYVPSKKKVAAFNLDGDVSVKLLETMSEKEPERLSIKTNIDLDALKGILEDEMKNRTMSEGIKKIVAVIQTLEGKKIWILNCILSGMEILKAHVDDNSKTVLKMEKASILDYIKTIPKSEMAQRPLTKSDVDKQIKDLDALKEKLEEEKEKLKE